MGDGLKKPGFHQRLRQMVSERAIELGRPLTREEQDELKEKAMIEVFCSPRGVLG